jgi:hypothetical protein
MCKLPPIVVTRVKGYAYRVRIWAWKRFFGQWFARVKMEDGSCAWCACQRGWQPTEQMQRAVEMYYN